MEKNLEKIKQEKSTEELLEFGIINMDKSSGPTSFDISDFVRKKLNLRKTSHFGTLDPKVTGVLPIALNRACKLTGFFLGEDKVYVGIMRIHEDISLDKIKKAINEKFIGKIIQLPPVKSRVKRQEREREVKKFNLLEKDGKNILFEVECQGGTYIRKLCSDLGDYLGIGAHMLELRRTRAGLFTEYGIFSKNEKSRAGLFTEYGIFSKNEKSRAGLFIETDKKYPLVNLYDFEKAVDEYKKGNEELLRKIIIPAEIISELYPSVQVKEQSKKQLLTGKPVFKKDLVKETKLTTDEKICIFQENQFIEIARVVNEGDILAKPEFVLQPIK